MATDSHGPTAHDIEAHDQWPPDDPKPTEQLLLMHAQAGMPRDFAHDGRMDHQAMEGVEHVQLRTPPMDPGTGS
jgi:hypothetical protein